MFLGTVDAAIQKTDTMIDMASYYTDQVNTLKNHLLKKRHSQDIGLIPFINSGDPDLWTTRSLLSICKRNQVCAVELGVPFGNSISDGETILRSHERAIRKKVEFEDVLEIVRDFRRESPLPIVLLVEYSHTIRNRGIESVVAQAKSVGVDGMLVHCLPPVLLKRYLDTARNYLMATVLGLFPNSSTDQINFVLAEATGFVYLASTYGKTGSNSGLSEKALSFFKKIRRNSHQPLAVGFGLKTRADLDAIYNSGVDAGIIGSPIVALIEQNLNNPEAICSAVDEYIKLLHNEKGEH